jgi:tetratricopeptide (TPR) repeat protein
VDRTLPSQSPAATPTIVSPPADVGPLDIYGPQAAQPIVLPPDDASAGQARVAPAAPPRHREMALINERAAVSVRAGYELAHRGALYSAQSEFTAALRIIAQALDAQTAETRHVQALVAGLTALEESNDFLAPARSATATIDVAAIVAKHRTPVLKGAAKEDLTPIVALQRYYTFAQEQLAAAVEHEAAASQALYGLGKLQTTMQASRDSVVGDGPKAIALHQAALIVDERNFMAANELGVLLARCGRYDDARAALAHSAAISPQPVVWRNLAAVHDQLGEASLAAQARAAAENTSRTAAASPTAAQALQQPVVWLDPAAFAPSAQPHADLQRGQPAAAQPTPVPQTSDKKSGFKWPLW